MKVKLTRAAGFDATIYFGVKSPTDQIAMYPLRHPVKPRISPFLQVPN
jgi:hypothetical protein